MSLCYYDRMRYVGIDFGKKRIGVAVSDENAALAFPQSVVQNDKEALEVILDICSVNSAKTVILGESKDFKGKDNEVMTDIREFGEKLKFRGLEVVFEPEMMTTIQAERVQGQKADIDASAAAIILQSYLDRIKPKNPDEMVDNRPGREEEDAY
jgi:putative Holliday junction resolvase